MVYHMSSLTDPIARIYLPIMRSVPASRLSSVVCGLHVSGCLLVDTCHTWKLWCQMLVGYLPCPPLYSAEVEVCNGWK
jgi:hypothetical protein